MVRMNPLNEMDGEAAAAAAAEGGRTGGGGDESSASYKRSRSSLDYKGDPASDTIIAQEKSPQTFDVDPRGGSSAPQQQQRQAQADVESMFAGMSPEEIIHHLTENPELARQLGFDPSTLANAQQAKSSTGGGGSSSSSRKAHHRTELLKSEGFPFVQWAIVLVVLGLGLYRIYMAVKLPAATAGKQKVKRKGGAGKVAKATDDIALSKVLAELEESGDEDFKAGRSKVGGVKKAKKKPPSKAKPKSQPPPQGKAAERTLVDDSDSEEESAPVPARKSKSPKNASVAAPVTAQQEVAAGGGEWQTVRGGKPTAATNGAGKQKPISAATDASKGGAVNGDSAPLPATAPEGSAADAKKKSKKKKMKASSESGGAPVSGEGAYGTENEAGTDDDEALAIRLQEQENNLSAFEEDDVWAEVTNKKKKVIKE